MQATLTHYTTESILADLGYPNPWMAARQQARMILLGRLARYQALSQQLERKWGRSLAEMRVQYASEGQEDFECDDDYLDWQWYDDAITSIQTQLEALAKLESERKPEFLPPS